MKITRKKRKGIKVEHNKKLFWVIIVLLIALIVLIWFIVQKEETGGEIIVECSADEDCVPATCCHPDSCVPIEQMPDCSKIMCTAVCSGPLDCGAGYCGCVKGKCEVISKE